MPCMSAGRPIRAFQFGSRCIPKPSAACAHCALRCCVGTTITTGRRCPARNCRNADNANVVLPAPGHATARKLSEDRSPKAISALRCHGRSVIARTNEMAIYSCALTADMWLTGGPKIVVVSAVNDYPFGR